MPKQKNLDSVAALSQKASKAKAVYLTDYRGLTHKQLEELHRTVKPSDAEYVVVKNSLLGIALKSINYKLDTTTFPGPTAALFAYGDEITPLKDLFKFKKTTSLPKIKSGFVGTAVYGESELTRLAKLPGKQELYGQVVSRVSGPMYGLVYALGGNLQKLVYVLGKIRN
jgi:large subunit ribosomal protein L10